MKKIRIAVLLLFSLSSCNKCNQVKDKIAIRINSPEENATEFCNKLAAIKQKAEKKEVFNVFQQIEDAFSFDSVCRRRYKDSEGDLKKYAQGADICKTFFVIGSIADLFKK